VANEFQPRQGTRVLNDAVTVFVDGGRAFHGWKAVSVKETLNSIANSFTLTLHDNFTPRGNQWPIKPGTSVRINIGETNVITGRVDQLSANFNNNARNYQVSGRSNAGDLIDSSVTGNMEYANVSVDELATKLVSPFGIQVFKSVQDSEIKTFDKFGIKMGESVFEAIDRAARLSGLLWVSTRGGNIRLTKAGSFRGVSAIGQDFNMVSGSIEIDNSDRFSEYIVRGQTNANDNFSGALASQPEGVATDAGISRFRPTIITAEGNVDQEIATQRAGWESSIRIARSQKVNVSLQGWRQEDGSLWGANQIHRVKSAFLGIDRDLLAESVERVQDQGGGTTTNISFVRVDSYQSKPNFQASEDLNDNLGGVV